MKGIAYFDSENLFRRNERKKAPSGMPATSDQQIFGVTERPQESYAKWTARRLDVTTIWFRMRTGISTLEIHSYGKPHDSGYEKLSWALSKRRKRYSREGVRYHLHPVPEGKNLAENALVADFRAQLQAEAPTETVFLIGGEDHDALYPVDHARLENPELDVWVLLPAQSIVWRRFRQQNTYPHLDPTKVLTIAELLRSVWQNESQVIKSSRAKSRKHDAEALARARSEAGMSGQLTGEALERRTRLEKEIARLCGIHEAGLHHAPPGSQAWIDGIGNDWAVKAADCYLEACTSESELAALRGGAVSGSRAAHLVRVAMVHDLLTREPSSVLRALIFGFVGVNRDYRLAAAALAEALQHNPDSQQGKSRVPAGIERTQIENEG